MKGRVLVTGASGFVGRCLIKDLTAAGYCVRAAARTPSAIPIADGIEPARLPDLLRPAEWNPLVSGATHIVHLAGIAHATTKIPEGDYVAANTSATASLAAAARRAGVKRMVLMSSVRAQSGPVAPHPVTERDSPAPTDAYGRSKLNAEHQLFLQAAGSGTSYTILRPVVMHGAGCKGNMRTLERLARSPFPLPVAAFGASRSLLSLANLSSAVTHVLEHEAAASGTFLVADPDPISIPEIIAAMRRALGRKPGIFHASPALLRRFLELSGRTSIWERVAGGLVADTQALRAIGWTPVETTQEGLTRAIKRGTPNL